MTAARDLVWNDADRVLRVPRSVAVDWKRHDPPMWDIMRDGVRQGVIGIGDRQW